MPGSTEHRGAGVWWDLGFEQLLCIQIDAAAAVRAGNQIGEAQKPDRSAGVGMRGIADTLKPREGRVDRYRGTGLENDDRHIG